MLDPVIIVDYDPAWPGLYEAERARLLAAIGMHLTAVEHIGSTSVPGLGAKPIIDILAGVRRLDDAVHCIAPLEAMGYEYKPHHEAILPERRYFSKLGYHIHMVEEGGLFWTRHIAFRDYLRADAETRQAYEILKRELAEQYRHDRVGYTDAKTEFIQWVEALAQRGEAG